MFQGKWTEKLTNVLLWTAGYVSFIAFAFLGGYIILKGNDRQKLITKRAFVIMLLFLAVSAFLDIFVNFGTMSNNYFGSPANNFHNIFTRLVEVARIGVFTTFIIIELVRKDSSPTTELAVVEFDKEEVKEETKEEVKANEELKVKEEAKAKEAKAKEVKDKEKVVEQV